MMTIEKCQGIMMANSAYEFFGAFFSLLRKKLITRVRNTGHRIFIVLASGESTRNEETVIRISDSTNH